MKKNLILFLLIDYPVLAAQICGPTVTNLEYSYTVENPSGTIAGYWAVGTGCANGEYVGDINTSCDAVVVSGYALCDSKNVVGVLTGRSGWDCYCARSYVLENGNLVNSSGFRVRIGIVERDTKLCQANCARMCAETLVTNTNGLRNAIMQLPVQVQ